MRSINCLACQYSDCRSRQKQPLTSETVSSGKAEGSLDAGNMLKPSLARGLQISGATTLNEYRQTIEKDAALTRRFQVRLSLGFALARRIELRTPANVRFAPVARHGGRAFGRASRHDAPRPQAQA